MQNIKNFFIFVARFRDVFLHYWQRQLVHILQRKQK